MIPQLGKIAELLSHKTNSVCAVPSTVTPGSGGVPSSDVVGRADLPDITKSLQVRFGVERIMFKGIERLQDETGPSAELVWRLRDDLYDRVRFVGNWNERSNDSGYQIYRDNTGTIGFIEIYYYGTGLRILTMTDANSGGSAIMASVDGGGESAILPTNQSNVLQSRGYAPLNCVLVVQNQSPGWHKVKLRGTSTTPALNILGMDILHSELDNYNLKIEAGEVFHRGSKNVLEAQQTPSAVSTFEAGTLATKGGRVAVYLKDDGTVAKAVNPVNESSGLADAISNGASSFTMQATPPADWVDGTILEIDNLTTKRELVVVQSIASLTVTIKGTIQTVGGFSSGATVTMYGQSMDSAKALSSSTSNEELATATQPREFGGDANIEDYLHLNIDTADDVAFTLMDNQTILHGSDQLLFDALSYSPLVLDSTNDVLVLDFVGTGISARVGYSASTPDTHQVYVDGVQCANFPTKNNTERFLMPLVSDLPYGSHTLRIRRTTIGTGVVGFYEFQVHETKAPVIDNDYTVLSSYHLLGTFKSSVDLPNVLPQYQIARGVIRKHVRREWEYIEGTGGTTDWDLGAASFNPDATIGGVRSFTDRAASVLAKLQFWGTGFELRMHTTGTNTSDAPMTANGLGLTVGNFPSISVETRGLTSTGSSIDTSGASFFGSTYKAIGLPLNNYTFAIGNTQAGEFLEPWAFDVVTPVAAAHSARISLNRSVEFRVGENSIRDHRQFSLLPEYPLNYVRTAAAESNPSQSSESDAGRLNVIEGMSTMFYSHTGYISVDAWANIRGTNISNGVVYAILVDSEIKSESRATILVANEDHLWTLADTIFVGKGWHHVAAAWRYDAGVGPSITATNNGLRRLIVRDLPAKTNASEDIVNE